MNQKKEKSSAQKSNKILRRVVLSCFVVVAGFLSFNSIQEVIKTFQLNQDLKAARAQYESASAKQEDLNQTKLKLEDSEYVQNYAYGSQLLSQEDEEVFVLIPTE